MKIAVLRGPRDLHIEDHGLDTSNLEPDEIWVKTEISALKIGTDRGNYEGSVIMKELNAFRGRLTIPGGSVTAI